MEYLALAVFAAVTLVAARWQGRSLTEGRRAMGRRIGWGYGTGTGFADAANGRGYGLTAPEDGMLRPAGPSRASA